MDIHPSLPWILVALYSGYANIYDFNTQATVKSFEVSSSPVRSARFVTRKQWIVVGSDDYFIRVFNYNTMEKVRELEAHGDVIRCLVVHPILPYVLSCSDDHTIKLWNWDKNWESTKMEGHTHFVMQLCINPKDSNSFASASLDATIKIWNVSTPGKALYSLVGHEFGVNTVSYCATGDKPYLASGSDDYTVKVWDYQTKNCLATLEGHQDNVSSVLFHPDLPIIISTSEDNTVNIWSAMTFKLETSIEYSLDRPWCSDALQGTNIVALGYDEGTVVLKLGSDYPLADFSNAKVIAAKNSQIFTYNLKLLQTEALVAEEKVSAALKELGNTDMYIQGLRFNSNGQLFATFGETYYTIYTSRAFKSVGYGTGTDLVWGKQDVFAIRVDGTVKIIKNGQDAGAFKVGYAFDTLFGGEFLAVKSEDSVVFFDWETQTVVRRIEVAPKSIIWNEEGTKLALLHEEGVYILKCNKEAIAAYLAKSGAHTDEGFDEAFELTQEIPEIVESAIWVNEAFVYVSADLKLKYFLGKKPSVISRVPKKMLLLGYISNLNRVFLIDKDLNMFSYELLQSVIQYQQAILGEDVAAAEELLIKVPAEAHLKLAKFLEINEHKDLAYMITPDPTHKLNLAVELGLLKEALELAKTAGKVAYWKQVGDLALTKGYFDIAEKCFQEAKDLSSLFLLYTATSDRDGLKKLQEIASKEGITNLAFLANYLLNDKETCINCLLMDKKIPEAAIFATSYCPSKLSPLIEQWNKIISETNKNQYKAIKILDPMEKLSEEKKQVVSKVEVMLDGVYNQEINTEDYAKFMEKYNEDLEAKVSTNPNFKFEYN